jgi:hypothetical protein
LRRWKLQRTQSYVNIRPYSIDYKPENIPIKQILSNKLDLRRSLSRVKTGTTVVDSPPQIKKSNSIRCSQSDNSLKYLDNSHSHFLSNSVLKSPPLHRHEVHSSDISGLIYFDNIGDPDWNKDIYDFRRLLKSKPKKDLILTRFAIFFRDNYFYNDIFKTDIQTHYNKFIKGDTTADINKQFNRSRYPVKVKNQFTNNYTRPFVKPNLKLLSNSQFYKITHNYIPKDNLQTDSNVILISNNFIYEQGGDSFLEINCEYITLEGTMFGKLNITNEYILFKSRFNNIYRPDAHDHDEKYINYYEYMFGSLESDIIYREKDVKIYLKDIKEVINRRFLHMWQGVEIFLKSGRSYYFNLFRVSKNDQFFQALSELTKGSGVLLIQNCKKYFKSEEYTKKWLEGLLTNFEYLSILNKFSSRSFHDMNQYPVFPWLITNYNNLTGILCYRALQYPVSVQHESKRLAAVKKYEDEKEEKFKVHFRCHYSTSAFISYYLIRLSPFTQNQIKLQTMKFDNPNRMFFSIKETWEILEKYSDNRELTPEFFSQPEILINLNCDNFGKRSSDGQRVDDVILPSGVENAVDFIYQHRTILESKTVSAMLNLWIDNIFGANQLEKNKDSLNIYNKESYEQEKNLEKKVEKYKKGGNNQDTLVEKIRDQVNTILNFGQTPHALFRNKHPKKVGTTKELTNDDFINVSDLLFSRQKLELKKFNKGVSYFNYSKSYLYVLNGDKEIEIFDKQFFKRKTQIRLKPYLTFNTFNFRNDTFIPVYKYKYLFIELSDCKYFIVCRYLDQTIKIYSGDNILAEILCETVNVHY